MEGDGVSRGAEDITVFVRKAVGRVESVHHGHMPEIELTSDTTASGVWSMEDKLRWTGRDGVPHRLHGYGHYHETYVRTDGGWLISSTRLTRLRLDYE